MGIVHGSKRRATLIFFAESPLSFVRLMGSHPVWTNDRKAVFLEILRASSWQFMEFGWLNRFSTSASGDDLAFEFYESGLDERVVVECVFEGGVGGG